jgi:hypothetical protein
MTTFPGSPKTLRGALVSIDAATLAPTVIAFQYNPHTLSRRFEIKGATGGPEVGQLTGPPAETIQVELVLDATDARADGGAPHGVAPLLAALQGLVTPPAATAVANAALAASGRIEILPPPAPVTLFVWGERRVVPVALAELTITEEAHDGDLDPTYARVTLGMRVLTHADLPQQHPAHALAVAGQVGRERMARTVTSSALDGVLGATVRLL